MYSWDRRDRLSVIGSLSVSARRRRIGLYFVVHEKNVTAEEVEAFLREVQRHLRRRLIVVMDRWAVHRKVAKNLFGDERFWIEWLPPYAPDLNPVEYVWDHSKRRPGQLRPGRSGRSAGRDGEVHCSDSPPTDAVAFVLSWRRTGTLVPYIDGAKVNSIRVN
jgi:hypothetical protein